MGQQSLVQGVSIATRHCALWPPLHPKKLGIQNVVLKDNSGKKKNKTTTFPIVVLPHSGGGGGGSTTTTTTTTGVVEPRLTSLVDIHNANELGQIGTNTNLQAHTERDVNVRLNNNNTSSEEEQDHLPVALGTWELPSYSVIHIRLSSCTIYDCEDIDLDLLEEDVQRILPHLVTEIFESNVNETGDCAMIGVVTNMVTGRIEIVGRKEEEEEEEYHATNILKTNSCGLDTHELTPSGFFHFDSGKDTPFVVSVHFVCFIICRDAYKSDQWSVTQPFVVDRWGDLFNRAVEQCQEPADDKGFFEWTFNFSVPGLSDVHESALLKNSDVSTIAPPLVKGSAELDWEDYDLHDEVGNEILVGVKYQDEEHKKAKLVEEYARVASLLKSVFGDIGSARSFFKKNGFVTEESKEIKASGTTETTHDGEKESGAEREKQDKISSTEEEAFAEEEKDESNHDFSIYGEYRRLVDERNQLLEDRDKLKKLYGKLLQQTREGM